MRNPKPTPFIEFLRKIADELDSGKCILTDESSLVLSLGDPAWVDLTGPTYSRVYKFEIEVYKAMK